jgi:molecular chaperone DnaK (HSP70)
MSGWAIDLGNTHTRVARFDPESGSAKLLELPAICRAPGGSDPLAAPRLIPSATDIVADAGWQARLGALGPLARHTFLGRLAWIGRPAVEKNAGLARPHFVPVFKPFLDREAGRPLTRIGRRAFSARDVARLFVRELLAEVDRTTGHRIRDCVFTMPVEAYDTYRAELQRIGHHLGIRRMRFLDEPVAAALGYGLGLTRERAVMVVDFGGGTMHVALVALSARDAALGRAEVIAKQGRSIGGRLVDGWLLEEFSRKLGFALDPEPADGEAAYWRRLMLAEACRVKEALFFQSEAVFQLAPPAHLKRAPGEGAHLPLQVTREDLVSILERRGVYQALDDCTAEVLLLAAERGVGERDVAEVLMVGGSSLLPGVYTRFETRFGRDRVRAWQPFEAVAFGASVYSADQLTSSDYIIHEYAFVTYDPRTHEKRYATIIPRGTRFPTAPDLWRQQVVPTCSRGEPETQFKLVIVELGRGGEDQRFVWDGSGRLHRISGGEATGAGGETVVVPLNENAPTLGELHPPHSPRDKKPRLEISFGVDAERWLKTRVVDLRTRKVLLDEEPVVRLL